MRRVLILGGGFGGIAVAHALRHKLNADDEITIVERRPHFMMGLRKSWGLVGLSTLEEGQRPLAALEARGIRIVAGTVTKIDPASRAAEVDGQRVEADALIVALGAQLAPEAVPGLADYALNVYDPAGIPRAAEALRNFNGGKLVVGIFGAPYKCPPAPYEMTLLINDHLKERGVKASITVFTPQPMSLPVLGEAGCSLIEGRLADHGITFLASHKATAIEVGAVVFGEKKLPYDLLLGVPPHKCPPVVADCGLTGGGAWVKVNPQTLETSFPDVYAIGDITEIGLANGMPLPKAGALAEQEGQVAAEHIAAKFAGRAPASIFEGTGACFLEVGGGQAMQVSGNFLHPDGPQVSLNGPSVELMQGKYAFESERLAAWFGS